jgi:hypothetical protein
MKLPVLKHSRLTRSLESKLGLDFRQGSERSAWYSIGGIPVLRVTIPKEKGRRDSLGKGTCAQIRNQLKLNNEQFRDLAVCPMTGTDYEGIIRRKRDQGLL